MYCELIKKNICLYGANPLISICKHHKQDKSLEDNVDKIRLDVRLKYGVSPILSTQIKIIFLQIIFNTDFKY